MSAQAVLGQLETSIEKLESWWPKLQSEINGVVNKINSILDQVPGWLDSLVEEIVQKAQALLKEIWDLAKQLWQWVQDNVWPVIKGPYTLYTAGNRWTTEVYKHATNASGGLDTSHTAVEDYWQGVAATAYMQTIPAQKAAADKIAEIADKVRGTLQDLAYTLASLYIAVVAGLLAALIQVAGGSAAVASLIGIPAGLMSIITGLLTGIATVGTVYAVGKEMINGSLEKFATLSQIKNDASAFPKGHWPKATEDLGDASMTDGDRSKWNYKR